MNRLTRNVLVVALFFVAATIFVACDDTDPAQPSATQAAAATEGPADALPAGLILDKSPEGARDLVAVKKSAKVGDAITMRGRVGGTEKPLADNRAIVTVVDSSVTTCEKTPDDACQTPWDACCDPDATKK